MAKKVTSMRLDPVWIGMAQEELNKYGVRANKSETVETALILLNMVCYTVFDEEEMLADRLFAASFMCMCMKNPEVLEMRRKLFNELNKTK